jgi:hypothetical protein
MQNERDLIPTKKDEQKRNLNDEQLLPEEAKHPVPGIKHKQEPDAENIMPVEDGPGTL